MRVLSQRSSAFFTPVTTAVCAISDGSLMAIVLSLLPDGRETARRYPVNGRPTRPVATKVGTGSRPRFADTDPRPTRPAGRRRQAEAMITVERLTKRYGAHPAVDDVSFTCEPGTVTGFLGPNGAGKSTTMRMIVGLTPPTSGSATVAGVPYRRLGNPGREIGVLLDASAQHAGRTGREVLTLAALTMGIDTREVPRALDRVGLNATAGKRRVRAYSLGMRQRLGLALALLGDPP